MSIEAIVCISLALLLCGAIYVLITKDTENNSSAMALSKDAQDLAHVTDKSVAQLKQAQEDFAATQVDLLSRLSTRVDSLEKEPKNVRVSLPKSITIDLVERPRPVATAAPIARSSAAPKVKPLIPTAGPTPMLNRAGIKTKIRTRTQRDASP